GLNTLFPWLLDGVEPLADALLMGFETDYDVMVEAILGEFSPSGKLPITFPIDADALAVDEDGRCASPNDVPGYAKEKHMDGRPYVYVDADGNRYELGHGLTYGA
ncbi:MAG: glycoside hydrolase family 3 protein, partial [Brachybacterium sp.]|nr:glycoside hydrolase family 3 protein [Brachybacterium sp.]